MWPVQDQRGSHSSYSKYICYFGMFVRCVHNVKSIVFTMLAYIALVWARPVRVGVIYYRPKSMSANTFEMGFVKAMRLLEGARHHDLTTIDVEWTNLDDFEGRHPEELALGTRFAHLDVLLVKSNWEWTVDRFVRQFLREDVCQVPKVLLVSGVHPPPSDRNEVLFYSALVYETAWYLPQIRVHPRTVHGFGIDASVMTGRLCGNHAGRERWRWRQQTQEEDPGWQWEWDWLFVGAFREYKRPRLLGQKQGRRLAVGADFGADDTEAARIVSDLEAKGVTVKGAVSYTALRGKCAGESVLCGCFKWK